MRHSQRVLMRFRLRSNLVREMLGGLQAKLCHFLKRELVDWLSFEFYVDDNRTPVRITKMQLGCRWGVVSG